jgi:hypothetical protein
MNQPQTFKQLQDKVEFIYNLLSEAGLELDRPEPDDDTQISFAILDRNSGNPIFGISINTLEEGA